VRHDCGIYEGWEVPVHYDPILSKLIVHATDREGARVRMLRALSELTIIGIETTVEYLRAIIETDAFGAGDTHTDFIDEHMAGWALDDSGDTRLNVALIAGALASSEAVQVTATKARALSPWDSLGNWRMGTGGR
jgi:acetyl/propionyl-CoA carboxylase alpha subunit